MGERLCFSVRCLAIEGHVSGRYIKKSGAEGFPRTDCSAGALKCKRESKRQSITGLNTRRAFLFSFSSALLKHCGVSKSMGDLALLPLLSLV